MDTSIQEFKTSNYQVSEFVILTFYLKLSNDDIVAVDKDYF